MYQVRTQLKWVVISLFLIGFGALVAVGTKSSQAAAPAATVTPTPIPTIACGDWRQWPAANTTELVNPLNGIAVASPDDIWAVGIRGGYGSTNPHVLIQRWDGTQWNLMPQNNPGTLQAVTVVAPDDVWAVGYYDDPARNLTMHWNGTAWSIVTSPNDAGVGNTLYSVAAAGPNDVWAVGTVQNQGRTLHWNGTQWNIVPIPIFSYSFLLGVDVVGPDDVWAVGSVGYYDVETLILHWDGSHWTQISSPSPGTFRNRLNAINALSANDIWAAGWATDGNSTFSGTILHWNGTQWSASPIAGMTNPKTTGSAQLYGITAASGTEAWAVGWKLVSSVRENVLLEWNGTTWTQVANGPNPSSYFNELEAIASVAPGEAWAVGLFGLESSGQYGSQILRYGPECGTPTATVTGTPPTATSTSTTTNTSIPTNTPTAIPTACGTLFSEGFESGTLGRFTSVVTRCVSGDCDWRTSSITPHTGSRDAFAPDVDDVSDQRLVLSLPIVPGPGSTLRFWHNYDFEGSLGNYYDGGVLEASTDGGAFWFDMGPNITSGGYVGTISFSFENPLASREAWGGQSGGYVETVVNLSGYAGQSLLFRFREGTDNAQGAGGWRIDDIQVTGGGSCASPTVIPVTGTGTSTRTSISTETAVVPTSTQPAATQPAATNTVVIPSATSTSEIEPTDTATPEATTTPIVEACSLQFSDVPEGSAFYTYVRCLACRSILAGYTDGTFRPNGVITRGQLAKIASNAAGYSGTPTGQTFEDMPPGDPFYMYVERTATGGVLGGYPCGGVGEPCGPESKPYFRPYASTTRGQVAKVIANAAGMVRVTATGDMFADVQQGSTFYDYIQMLTSHDAMGGYPCGGEGEPCDAENRPYFRPYNYVTRGQTAKIVEGAFFPNCQTPLR